MNAESSKTTRLVVSKFREDLSWLSKIPSTFDIVIYSKDPDETEPSFRKLPNIGSQAHTYLTHILKEYETHPALTVFTDGNPFKNAPSFFGKLAEISTEDFQNLGDKMILFDEMGLPQLFGNPPTSSGMFFKDFYHHIFDRPPPNLFFCGDNAPFAVARDAILRRPVEFYETCLETITYSESIPGASRVGRDLMESRFFERLWHVVYKGVGHECPINGEILRRLGPIIAAYNGARRKGDAGLSQAVLLKGNDILRELQHGVS